MPRLALHWRMVLATGLAAATGQLAGDGAVPGALPLGRLLDIGGTLFLGTLKMLMVPLVVSGLIVGIARGGSGRDIGRLGVRTVAFYLVTTIAAIVLGLVVVSVIEPGIVHGQPAREVLALETSSADLADEVADKGFDDLLDGFLGIVPGNIVSAAAGDDLPGLLFFSALFGFFMARLDHSYADPLLRFWSGAYQVMMRISGVLMSLSPVGIFCLLVPAFARTGAQAAGPLVSFAAVVLIGLAGHAALVLPAVIRVVGGVSPLAMYRAVAPAFLVALSTASSTAALPITLNCMEQRAGVSNRVATMVLPLGAVINMNGTALYEAVAAVFMAQAYGLDLTLATQLVILAIAVVTSIGVPGLPYAPLVAIAIILSAIGLPTEAIGVLLVVDGLLQMARAGVNVLGDAACAAVIARLEGETLRAGGGDAAA